ncbi:MAG: carbohydrate-binding domain-containing protein [Acutalibacteraceae bacterium]
MSTHKQFDKICYAVLAVTLIITALFMNGKSLGLSTMENEDTGSDMFTANDLNSEWDSSDAQTVVLSDNGNTVKGSGAYVSNGDIYIVNSGRYVITGELSDGSIIIDAENNDKIWLLLNGVSINCNNDAAIKVEQADKVFLTLADSTQNTVSSGSQYDEVVISSGVDGAIYSRDDLTINGNGSLNVTAEYRHGIVCNDDLIITGGNITVNAVQDGIHANDSVRITKANINISAGDDGITVSNDDNTAYLYIESGNIDISSCYEGLEAIDITIAGGTINISATDDGINANGNSGNSVIRITGGDITITNSNGRDADGLDSNKDIYISGGNILISLTDNGSNSAIDYGTESGGVCEISSGAVIACGSSGMAEGFSSSSTQGFIMYTASANAETKIALKDADGNELISSEIPFSFSSIVISTPQMKVGDTCTVIIGDIEEELTIDNSVASSGFGRGKMNVIGGNNGFAPKDNSSNQEDNINQNENSSDIQTPPEMKNGYRHEKPTDSDSESVQPQIPDQFGDENINPGIQDESGAESIKPEIPDESGDNSLPDMPQKNGTFGRQQNGELPNEAENTNDENQTNAGDNSVQFGKGERNFSDKQSALPSDDSQTNISKDAIILLSVSVGVLISGCVIALIIKRKK